MGTRAARQRRAAVTGASTGIGEAFSERLARDGWDLCLVARRKARLEALAKRLRRAHGVRVQVFPADLTDPAALRALERHLARDARLELLVNDAGMGDVGAFEAHDLELVDAEIRLNVLAVVRLTHAALRGMLRRRRGAVINVSSTAAFQPFPYAATYGGTKAFLNSFTEALHEELRGSGVRGRGSAPGSRTPRSSRGRERTCRACPRSSGWSRRRWWRNRSQPSRGAARCACRASATARSRR
jgi:uncharacterized protein